MVAGIFDCDAKTLFADHRQGDPDSYRGHYLQAIDRSRQGQDCSFAGCGCSCPCSQSALQEKAVGEKNPSAALDLLQNLRVGTGSDPGGRDLKTCDGVSDDFWHKCL
jgi:hypothetical protein